MARLNEETMVNGTSAIFALGDVVRANKAYLIIVAGPGAGDMFAVQGEEIVIGRALDCNVVLEHPSISRRHARLALDGNGNYTITDNGSTNGTYVNGSRITQHTLRDGEKIQIGCSVILKYSFQDSIDEQFQKKLIESAIRDPLTQIYNRKYLLDRLATDFSHAIRHSRPLSLMIMDIDHFKLVNDTFGHLAGDFVLRRMAKSISPIIRVEDTFARYGGEEFVVVMRDTDKDQAFLLGERIRTSVEALDMVYETHPIPITISIGVGTLREGNYQVPSALLKAADTFLYAAKAAGRNRVVTIDSGVLEPIIAAA